MPQTQTEIQEQFYPLTPSYLQKKRIHLFGENIDKLTAIESACLSFNVIVTGEEV